MDDQLTTLTSRRRVDDLGGPASGNIAGQGGNQEQHDADAGGRPADRPR